MARIVKALLADLEPFAIPIKASPVLNTAFAPSHTFLVISIALFSVLKLATPPAIPIVKGTSQSLLDLTKSNKDFKLVRIVDVAVVTIGVITANVPLIAYLRLSNCCAIDPKPASLKPVLIAVIMLPRFLTTELLKLANDVPIPALFFLAKLAKPLTPPFNSINLSFNWSIVISPFCSASYRSVSADLPVYPNELATLRNAIGIVSINVLQLAISTLPVDNICVYCINPRLASPALAPLAKNALLSAKADLAAF